MFLGCRAALRFRHAHDDGISLRAAGIEIDLHLNSLGFNTEDCGASGSEQCQGRLPLMILSASNLSGFSKNPPVMRRIGRFSGAKCPPNAGSTYTGRCVAPSLQLDYLT